MLVAIRSHERPVEAAATWSLLRGMVDADIVVFTMQREAYIEAGVPATAVLTGRLGAGPQVDMAVHYAGSKNYEWLVICDDNIRSIRPC